MSILYKYTYVYYMYILSFIYIYINNKNDHNDNNNDNNDILIIIRIYIYIYVHAYVYCIYTHPLFCASHSSWWNDQGKFRELDKGMICPSSMAMMTHRNISRGYCK